MTIRDSLLSEITHYTLYYFFRVNSIWMISRLVWQILNCQNINILVLISHYLRKYIFKSFSRRVNWVVRDVKVTVERSHVYNSTLALSLLHIRAQVSCQEYHWKSVYCQYLHELLIWNLMDLLLKVIKLFHIVDQNRQLVVLSDIFNAICQFLVIKPSSFLAQVKLDSLQFVKAISSTQFAFQLVKLFLIFIKKDYIETLSRKLSGEFLAKRICCSSHHNPGILTVSLRCIEFLSEVLCHCWIENIKQSSSDCVYTYCKDQASRSLSSKLEHIYIISIMQVSQ